MSIKWDGMGLDSTLLNSDEEVREALARIRENKARGMVQPGALFAQFH